MYRFYSNLHSLSLMGQSHTTTSTHPCLEIPSKEDPILSMPRTHTPEINQPTMDLTSHTMEWTVHTSAKVDPFLNEFLCYLRSPGHNKKPRMSMVGGVLSMFACSFTSVCLVCRYLQTHMHCACTMCGVSIQNKSWGLPI